MWGPENSSNYRGTQGTQPEVHSKHLIHIESIKMSTKHSSSRGFLDEGTRVKVQVSAFTSCASVDAFSQK